MWWKAAQAGALGMGQTGMRRACRTSPRRRPARWHVWHPLCGPDAGPGRRCRRWLLSQRRRRRRRLDGVRRWGEDAGGSVGGCGGVLWVGREAAAAAEERRSGEGGWFGHALGELGGGLLCRKGWDGR